MAGDPANNSAAARCKNCGATLKGKYCAECGQRHLKNGLDAGELAAEMVDSVVRPNSKLWHTIKALTLNPGQVAADYAAGKRARFVNPLRYCFAAVAIAMAATFASGEMEQISQQMMPSDVLENNSQGVQHFLGLFGQYMNILALVAVPAFAAAFRLLYWKAGRNYAECFTFTCFIVGHASLLGLFATLFNMLVIFTSIIPSMIINFVIYVCGTMVFFKSRFWIASIMVVLAFIFYLTVMNMMFLGVYYSPLAS